MNNKIAIYLRLSLSDGDLKREARMRAIALKTSGFLLHSYIEKQDDLPQAKLWSM